MDLRPSRFISAKGESDHYILSRSSETHKLHITKDKCEIGICIHKVACIDIER